MNTEPFDDFKTWRLKVLNWLLASVAMIGFFAWLVAVAKNTSRYIRGDMPLESTVRVVAGISIVYFGICTIAFFKRQTFIARALLLLFLVGALGIISLKYMGLSGAGRTYLIAVVLLSGVLLGFRWSMVCFGISVMALVVYAVLFSRGMIIIDESILANSSRMSAWVSGILDFCLFTATINLSIVYLFECFQKSVAKGDQDRSFVNSVLDQAGAMLAVLDPSGCIVRFNRASEQTTGYPREEILGTRMADAPFFSPRVRTEVEALQKRIHHQREDIGGQLNIHHRGGEVRHIIWSNKVLFDAKGEVQNTIISALDVTERLQAEQAAQSAEFKFQQLYEHSPSVYFTLDLEGRIVQVNRPGAAILGYNPEDLIGKLFFDFLVDAGTGTDLPSLRDLISCPERSLQEQCQFLSQNGNLIWVDLLARFINEPGKNEAHIFVVCQDINDKKMLEKEFQQAQKMEAIGRLAGGIAHDFNNILSVINGYSELLGMKVASKKEIPLNHIDMIRDAGQRASGLTRRLLAVSRKQEGHFKPININQLLGELEKLITPIIGEDIQLETQLQENVWPILADGDHLHQAFMNLSVNARDAMPQGGSITIRTRNRHVDPLEITGPFHQMEPGSYVQIIFEDTGSGIPAEQIERVFEPFYTTKPEGKGTGLGLSMVYGNVKQNGGYIFVKSLPGKGTRFDLFFPATDQKEREIDRGEQNGETLCLERILVVEDDEPVRLLVQTILQEAGYEVVAVEDASEATQIFSQNAPSIDLLLADFMLPGGTNGLELSRQLQREAPSLKIVIMSGYPEHYIGLDPEERARIRLISKPIVPRKLLEQIRLELNDSETTPLV